MMAGSAASSLHGIARPTMNIDLVADLRADQVEELVAELKVDFYADREMIREALARGRSFNLIHYASSFKFDIFPLQKDEFSQTQFARRQSRRWRDVRAAMERPAWDLTSHPSKEPRLVPRRTIKSVCRKNR